MKNPQLFSVLAIVLSIAALAAVLLDSPGAQASTGTSELGEVPAAAGGLVAQVRALKQQNQALLDRITRLEARPAAPPQRMPAIEGFATLDDLDSLRKEFGGTAPQVEPASVEDPTVASEEPVLKKEVAAALTEIRKEEAIVKARAELQGWSGNMDETMPKVVEWLKLEPYQSTEMRTALEDYSARQAEMLLRWERGESDERLGEQKRTDRRNLLDRVGLFLNEEQFETFQQRIGSADK